MCISLYLFYVSTAHALPLVFFFPLYMITLTRLEFCPGDGGLRRRNKSLLRLEVGGRDDGAGSVRGGSVGLGRGLDSALGR